MDLLVDETVRVASDNEMDAGNEFDDIARPFDEPIQLTEEQLERIRLNKEKALKRLQDAKNAAAINLPSNQLNVDNTNRGNSEVTTEIEDLESSIPPEIFETETFASKESESYEEQLKNVALSNVSQEIIETNETDVETSIPTEIFETETFESKEEQRKDSALSETNEAIDSQEDEEMDIESLLNVIAQK